MFLKDRLQITTKREYTDEGFLKVPARISRIGIQEYLAVEMGITDKEPGAIIRVYRPEEEVFSEDSLASFATKPITDNHPPELVTSKNAKRFSVGHVGPEVTRDGMFAQTLLHITDADAITKIESGKVELSNGYTADIEWTPGISPNGEQYDAIQRNIKGNHVAIVEKGRAGSECRLADNLPTNGDKAIMAKITIDGVDYEVSDQAGQAVGKLQGRLFDAEKETQESEDELKKKKDEAEAKEKESKATEDTLQAKLDDAIAKAPTGEALDKLVADRAALVAQVTGLVPDLKWEGKDTATLKREVVAIKRPNVQLDSVSGDYIDAAYDLIVEEAGTNTQQTLDDAFTKQITDGDKSDQDNRPASVIAREKMMADSQNAWKGSKA